MNQHIYFAAALLLAGSGFSSDLANSFAKDVGKVTGKLAITDQGDATYSVALKALPVGNSFIPKIGLAYHSRSSAGIAGRGWSLAGLPSITRCKANTHQDGFAHKPDLSLLDRFCLEGQKLKVVKGDYGAAGSEYRTYKNTFAKIVAVGQAGSGPASFVVYHKDGNIERFGSTSDAILSDPKSGSVARWALDSIADRFTNSITIKYLAKAPDQLALYPSKITYGGNTRAGLTGYRSMAFEYKEQAPVTKFLAGVSYIESKALSRIKINSRGSTAYTYTLQHQEAASSYAQLLKSIELCSYADRCLPATSFSYEDEDLQVKDDFKEEFSDLKFLRNSDFKSTSSVVHSADFNQDGYEDILAMSQHITSPMAIAYGGPNGFGERKEFPEEYCKYWDPEKHLVDISDIDGDGFPDIVFFLRETIRIVWGSQDGFVAAKEYDLPELGEVETWGDYIRYRFIVDMNQDGLVDVVAFNARNTVLAIGTGDRERPFEQPKEVSEEFRYDAMGDFTAFPRSVADINDDGLPDLIAFSRNGLVGSLNTGRDFKPLAEIVPDFGWGAWTSFNTSTHFSDVNGDGYPDAVGFNDRGVYVSLGSAKGFGSLDKWVDNFKKEDGFDDRRSYRLAYDLNRDGYADFIGIYNNLVRVVLGTGSSLIGKDHKVINAELGSILFNGTEEHFDFTDINNDGGYDFFVSDEFRAMAVQWRVPSLRLKTVVEGNGHSTTIDWGNLVADGLFTPCSDRNYQIDKAVSTISGPLPVVKSVSKPNGVGGNTTVSYSYGCARYHKLGLGFLGFESITEHEKPSGIAATKRYSHNVDAMTVGQLVSRSKKQWLADGSSITLENSYHNYETRWNSDKSVYANYNTKSVIEKYDTSNNVLAVVTTTSSYDDHGNVIQSTISTKDKYAIYNENAFYTYFPPDDTNWLIGQVASIESEIGRGSGVAFTKVASRRKAQFTYDEFGSIASETTLAGTDLAITLVNTGKDLFGNILASEKKLGNSGGMPANVVKDGTNTFDSEGFLTATTNALGHTNKYRYDSTLGLPIAVVSANGHETATTYDSWGRAAEIRHADGRKEFYSWGWCKDIGGCRPDSLYIESSSSNYGPTSSIEFDIYERKLRTRSQAFGNKQVVTDFYFDEYGRPSQKSLPFFDGDNPLFVQTLYDPFHRVAKVVQPDGATTAFTYDGFDVTKTNPLGYSSKVEKNALGRKLKVSRTDPVSGQISQISYRYNQRGLLAEVIGADGKVMAYGYNDLDRKTSSTDPEFGTSTIKYNSLGLAYESTSPSGQAVFKAFDLLGRTTKTLVKKKDHGERSVFTEYDSAKHGIGAVAKMWGPLHEIKYRYDSLSRLETQTDTIRERALKTNYTYGPFSRVTGKQVANGFGVRYTYDDIGTMISVSHAKSGQVYWQLEQQNAQEQITQQMGPNSIRTYRFFDPVYGNLAKITAGSEGLDQTPIYQQSYGYDSLRRLTSRSDGNSGLEESFSYDGFDRLIQANSSKYGTEDYKYGVNGNILSRTTPQGSRSYQYGAECANQINRFKNAVCQVKTEANGQVSYRDYSYDANGNMIGHRGNAISYNIIEKVESITKQDPTGLQMGSTHFYYGAKGRKIERVDVSGSVSTTTTFVAGDFEIVESGGKSSYRHRIGDAVVHLDSSGKQVVYNTFKDHLGSITKVTGPDGNVAKLEEFDPFGKRRVDNDIWGGSVSTAATLDGFTGHHQIDSVGLVHMGGRIYDPDLGRFLSPDLFIQDLQNEESFNRYSYVWNNPLSHTDPSGYFVRGIFNGLQGMMQGIVGGFAGGMGRLSNWLAQNERMVYATAIRVGSVMLAATVPGLGAWAIMSAGGYVSAYVSTSGNQRAAAIGAITAIAFHGIGQGIPADSVALKTISHGAVSGAAGSAQGGDFASNFAAGAVNGFINSSGLISDFGPNIDSENGTLAYNMAVSAVAGGLTSQAISGNFESGFESALVAHLFNCFETAWDLFNVGLSAKAISEWDENTTLVEKGIDSLAFAADTLAAATPVIPSVVGPAVRGAKALFKGRDYAKSAVGAVKLKKSLAFKEANSIFEKSGHLKNQVVSSSRLIVEGGDLRNKSLVRELIKKGGNIEDWAKYETKSHSSPSGAFKVHFYKNRSTGALYYGKDYKSVFNHQGRYK